MASQVGFFNNYQAKREIVKFNNFPFSKNGLTFTNFGTSIIIKFCMGQCSGLLFD